MNKKRITILSIIIALLIILALAKLRSISLKGEQFNVEKGSHPETALEKIKREGKIRVVVANNSIDYFSYKGRMMGFKYEMLNQLAKDLGVEMELYVQDNLSSVLEGLNRNLYDLAAQNITITKTRRKVVDFTIPVASSEQVLVQRRPTDWHKLAPDELDSLMVQDQLQLAGKKVIVPSNSSFVSRLLSLSDEIGDTIYIGQDSISNVESLIADVSKGVIDYTIAHRDVAEVNSGYYDNIDTDLPISFKQDEAWIVKKGNSALLSYLNDWLLNYMQTRSYSNLYAKYYFNRREYISPENIYTNLQGGRLSPYDELIQRKCEEYNVDWRLISALIFTESSFEPNAVSWVGAQGLMQVMPDAAKTFNVDEYLAPEGNLEAGIRLFKWLDKVFMKEIPNPDERIKFVLASYNVGLGHVRDAQRLAEKYGKIGIVWQDNVDYYLLNKSRPEFLNDPVVKYGSCRGDEPYQYVQKVLDTYRHYCNLVPY